MGSKTAPPTTNQDSGLRPPSSLEESGPREGAWRAMVSSLPASLFHCSQAFPQFKGIYPLPGEGAPRVAPSGHLPPPLSPLML